MSGASFLTPLIVQHLDNYRWRVVEPFEYHDDGDCVIVPVGFETDFASIPRVFWSIYPPAGPWGKAAVVHDRAYRQALYPRKRCDEFFLNGMAALGVPRLRRQMMYRAVRAFGGGAYGKEFFVR